MDNRSGPYQFRKVLSSMNFDDSGRPSSISVNSEVEGDMRLYVDLFSNPQRLLRDGLADESYSHVFQSALRRDQVLQSIGEY